MDAKEFVRGTLGCDCPDEVLEHIHVEEGAVLPNGQRLTKLLRVGGRLLVYVVDETDAASVAEVHALLEAGTSERDRLGFNRFRLALVTEHPDEVLPEAEAALKSFPGRDDKVHVHAVDRRAVSF